MKRKTLLPLGMALLAGTAAYIVSRNRSRRGPSHTDAQPSLPNQAIYHFYAPIYDYLFGPIYAAAHRRTIPLLELCAGERLLISGVGTGLDLPLIEADVDVTGVDISPDMLQQAARKITQAEVQLFQMDAMCLDFPTPDATHPGFDAALLNLIVSVAPDGHAVFQEAWRVLKPGGRLVLFDKFAPEERSIGPVRKALGGFFRLIGTDVNRKLSDVVGPLEDGVIELNEPSLFFGQYRIVRFRKGAA